MVMRVRILLCLAFLGFIFLAKPAAALAAATLSLSPATASPALGSTFAVDIVLDTGGDAVSGATAILTYDTSKLSVVDDDPNTTGVQIKQGTIFNQSPLTNTVDTTVGQIRYDSGSLGTTYNGHGTMATIHFKANAVGTAQVSFTFDPNSTTNTSLVAAASGPTNLLTTVNNATYTISSGGGSSTAAPLPGTGAVEDTLMALLAGGILVAAGIILRKKFLVEPSNC